MKLGILLKKYRAMIDIELRSLAKEIGISAATLMRIEHGYLPDGRTVAKVLAWMFADMPDDQKRTHHAKVSK